MQDGASPHIARAVMSKLRAHFEDDPVILRSFPRFRPPFSPDLKPCDRLWWKHTKPVWYEIKITCHVAAIVREAFCATVEHAITRFEYLLGANGKHIEHMFWINKVFCFQFESFGLHAPFSHLVVEIWRIIIWTILLQIFFRYRSYNGFSNFHWYLSTKTDSTKGQIGQL